MQNKERISVTAAVIVNDRKEILITKRMEDSHLAGMWEFPGGKVDGGETPEQALVREIFEELNVTVDVKRLLWEEQFDYPTKSIYIRFYLCTLTSPQTEIQPIEVADYRWVSIEELTNYAFPPADAAFIEKLQTHFSEYVQDV